MSEGVIEDGETGAESTEWTQENLQKLFASLKDTLPENKKTQSYIRGLKAVDWDKVAFPPFSAGECREKWNSIMGTICKYRTLLDILDEAEDLLSNPFSDKNIHPDMPKPPYPPRSAYIRKNMSRYARKNPEKNVLLMKNTFYKKYDELSDKKKAKYAKKYSIAFEEYSRKIKIFCKKNNLQLPDLMKKRRKGKTSGNGGEGNDKYKGLPQEPPRNGYILFLIEHSKAGKAGETSHGTRFIPVMNQRWKQLSETKKQMYNERCAEMKKEYEAKLMKYLNKLNEEEKKQVIEKKKIKLPKKTSVRRHMRLLGEPKKPTHSAYVYFCSDMFKHTWKSLPRKESEARARKEWHELSEREKNRYAEIAQENMRKYTEELKAWYQKLTEEDQRAYLKKKPHKATFFRERKDVKKESHDLSSDSKDEKKSRAEESVRTEVKSEDEKDGNTLEAYH
ncbi:nucleolar transcription factor 1-like [Gambusia affinis]|uniref:nucleolar transcription factor 1-like n=1 Tax=Gambusia affinis TaxID=33528 RepID=UPI001CDD7FDF|nr:nucleolar transcription factor 1-like [Gambusia affinis]